MVGVAGAVAVAVANAVLVGVGVGVGAVAVAVGIAIADAGVATRAAGPSAIGAPMNELARRRAIHALGERSLDYYRDTGLCVFCDADDCQGTPHEEHCDVGFLSGIDPRDPSRVADKVRLRDLVNRWISRGGGQ